MHKDGFAVGIDIGGTKTALGLVGRSGEILVVQTLPTLGGEGFEADLLRIRKVLDEMIAGRDSSKLVGIGVGCTGPVFPDEGTIHNPYTLPGWDGADIVSPLQEAYGVAAYLENDADAAAFGEASAMGGGRGIVLLTFGTGVGGGVVLDGRIYRGCGDDHPELGHIPVDPSGPDCYCGSRGCLESIASGSALESAGREAGFEGSREVFEEASKGNRGAVEIVERARSALFVATWTILHTFLPDRIVLGGGIMDDHYALFEPCVRRAFKKAKMVCRGEVVVSKARLGNRAGLLGAAHWAFEQAGRRRTR